MARYQATARNHMCVYAAAGFLPYLLSRQAFLLLYPGDAMKRYATCALCLPLTAALLAACGGGGATTGPAPTGSAASTITTVNGTVDKWTGGASTVELLALSTNKSSVNPALASATLNANGTFTLTLPSLATITPYLSAAGSPGSSVSSGGPGCTGTVTNSDPTVQGYGFSTLSVGSSVVWTYSLVSTPATATTPDTVKVSERLWLYLAKPTTLSGSTICTETLNGIPITTTTSVNAPLTQGWNALAVTGTLVISTGNTSGTGTVSYSTVSDAPSTWYLLSQTGAQSLQTKSAAARFVSAQATFGKLLGGHLKF